MDNKNTLTFQVKRYSPENEKASCLAAFEVPYQVGMSVMDALHYAQENYDPSLAFDCSCRIGICKACAVKMNGEVVMACSTVARDGMVLEPVNNRDIKRDLIVRPKTQHASVAQIISDLTAD